MRRAVAVESATKTDPTGSCFFNPNHTESAFDGRGDDLAKARRRSQPS